MERVTESKPRASIDEWCLMYDYGVPQIVGTVSGHGRLEDGLEVRTSVVLRIDFEKGVAETMNTIYSLGNHR